MEFNWQHYRDLNKDLKNKFTLPQDFINHYKKHGMMENRNYNIYMKFPDFNWNDYRNNYNDLQIKLKSKEQLEQHWLSYGQYEGRTYIKQTTTLNNKEIINNKNAIYIDLFNTCGFGNLLFIVCHGLALSYEYNMPIYFKNYKALREDRPNICSYNIFSLLKYTMVIPNDCIKIKEPNDFIYNKISLNINNNYLISGYYQSFKYFNKYLDILKTKLLYNYETILTTIETKFHSITKGKKTILLHVRRGDYIEYKDVHLLINESYYEDALNKFFTIYNRDEYNIYMMTDSINETKSWNIISKFNIIFIEEEIDDIDNSEKLFLYMRLFDHYIIANSSLSLIAYYFRINIKATITFPPVWINNLFNYNDMIPDMSLYIDITKKLDNVYIINLEERIDRKNASLIQSKKIANNPIISIATKHINGSIGCTISHIMLLEKAIELQLPYIVILEDDILITNETYVLYSIDRIMTTMSWDVIILSGVVRNEVIVDNLIAKVLDVQTTTGYIVNSSYYKILHTNFTEGYNKLINNKLIYNEYCIDIYWKKLQIINNWFTLRQKYIYQTKSYSNILNKMINYEKNFKISKKNICEYLYDIPVINLNTINMIFDINVIFHNYEAVIICIDMSIITYNNIILSYNLLTSNTYDLIQLDCNMNDIKISGIFNNKINQSCNAFILNNYSLNKIINNRNTYFKNNKIRYDKLSVINLSIPLFYINKASYKLEEYINDCNIKDTTMIDLKNIPTIVLNHIDNVIRNKHVVNLLTCINLDYKIFNSLYNINKIVSGALSMRAIFTELLQRDTFTPALILEDDINITNYYSPIINIPIDCDCIYTGLSKCSAKYNEDTYMIGVPWEITSYNKLVKIKNMLSSHSFLITSRKYLISLIKCMEIAIKYELHYDIPIARNMCNYKVYAYRYPIFYQDAIVGGQEEPTLLSFDNIKQIGYIESTNETCIKYFTDMESIELIDII